MSPTRATSLDGFVETATRSPGVAVADLRPDTTLEVLTQNSRYRMHVCDICRRDIVIEGGRYLPRPTRARLNGATFGGSLLRIGWIILGMRMEVGLDDTFIVTSPVRRIAIQAGSSTATWPEDERVLE